MGKVKIYFVGEKKTYSKLKPKLRFALKLKKEGGTHSRNGIDDNFIKRSTCRSDWEDVGSFYVQGGMVHGATGP